LINILLKAVEETYINKHRLFSNIFFFFSLWQSTIR